MDTQAPASPAPVEPGFSPVETVPGPLDGGALIICDHASNAIPPGYGSLGLGPEALERHIAFDIGAADLTRALAQRLRVPAVLSSYSRLLIDPNRGPDDPTLVMRYSDGAIVPGNARADAAEIARRRELYWTPYRRQVEATVVAMTASGEPPALVSIHSFTPIWRGTARRWKIGVLWDRDDRIKTPLIEALSRRTRSSRRRHRRQRALRRGARRRHDRRHRHRARPRQRPDRNQAGPDRRQRRRARLGRAARPPARAHSGRPADEGAARFRQPRPGGEAIGDLSEARKGFEREDGPEGSPPEAARSSGVIGRRLSTPYSASLISNPVRAPFLQPDIDPIHARPRPDRS